jgi:ribonuclease HII
MVPDLVQELALFNAGYFHIAGIDEAGRGAWAGPVYAAAVVLPLDRPDLADVLEGVRDSKLLSPSKREALLPTIEKVATGVGIGHADPDEIDAMGIVPATRLAMTRALSELNGQVSALLIDYVHLPEVDLYQRVLPKADTHCLSVAAASIVAKVSRDRLMVTLDRKYPNYGLAQHKGYGTRLHRKALEQWGPSFIHRKSWHPINELMK